MSIAVAVALATAVVLGPLAALWWVTRAAARLRDVGRWES